MTAEVVRYHAIARSNFARGYDKYARRYSKRAIAESRFPDRFFLLERAALAAGIDKASGLAARTGLSGDGVLVLETRVDPRSLHANLRTGVGEYVDGDMIDVEAIYEVEGGALRRVEVEDASAASLACHARTSWRELRPRSVSLLPVARGCQAACEFCFSHASASTEIRQQRLDPARVDVVLDAARSRGAERAVITGGGEPGLLDDDALLALVAACARRFDKVVLITNGYALAIRKAPALDDMLARLDDAGLGVLSISRHHHEPAVNTRVMRLCTGSERVIERWRAMRSARLMLRTICVLQRGAVQDASSLDGYLAWAAQLGVPEVCMKELYVSTSRESVYHDARANQLSRERQVPLALVLAHAEARGWSRVGELPWGAPIFDARVGGHAMKVAAYTEPSAYWELRHGLCRSWNLMADGRCLASLEDGRSEVL